MKKKLVLICSIVLLIALACTTLVACGGNKYSHPADFLAEWEKSDSKIFKYYINGLDTYAPRQIVLSGNFVLDQGCDKNGECVMMIIHEWRGDKLINYYPVDENDWREEGDSEKYKHGWRIVVESIADLDEDFASPKTWTNGWLDEINKFTDKKIFNENFEKKDDKYINEYYDEDSEDIWVSKFYYVKNELIYCKGIGDEFYDNYGYIIGAEKFELPQSAKDAYNDYLQNPYD